MKITHKKLGLMLAGFGVLVMTFVFAPLITYEISSQSDLAQNYISPVPENNIDFTSPSNWFVGVPSEDTGSSIQFYNLTIPKLGIKGAVVSVGGEDLADSLIQFPGTALPGKHGNTVVFGHSVLPAFYDPSVYLTIFSTLPSMKKQDTIELEYDGIKYQYQVSEMYEVLPTNLDVLSQNTDGSYISLITCVPPGDPRRPRRLVVKARLVPPHDRIQT